MAGLKKLDSAIAVWRSYGSAGLVERALYEWRKRARRYRTAPSDVPASVATSPLPAAWPFALDRERIKASSDRAEGLARAKRVLAGEHQAYRWTWMSLPDSPVSWRTHPVSGHVYDERVPWYRVGHYSRDAGDIKDMWEPGRFGWTYDLIRGWILTGDEAYPRAFWTHFEDFIEGCPPFLGVQWSCGQETSIRAVAWLWAESAFADASSSTPERLAKLRRALVWSAERVGDAIGYSLSQRNNHGLSEAMGLVVVGARFHGVEPRSAEWFSRGLKLLDRQILDQFGEDGWFIQHSFNYMRLALEHLVVAQRVLVFKGTTLGSSQLARIRAAAGLLGDVMAASNGRVPNHGNNDGAYVLPLSTAGYLDFRPALTAAAATFGMLVPEDIEPNPEMLAWLGTSVERAGARSPVAVGSGSSGWVIARSGKVKLFARAGRYSSRPAHIDPLHVDIWFDDVPVATDAGTYRYWANPPWANALVDAELHNTVTIEGMPIAERGPRYLWLSWPSARVVDASLNHAGRIRIELANESWVKQGVSHGRVCEVDGETVTITDAIQGEPSLNARAGVHWLVDGTADVVRVTGPGEVDLSVVTGTEASVRGWVSEGYGTKRPVSSVKATASIAGGELSFVSTFDLATGRGPAG